MVRKQEGVVFTAQNDSQVIRARKEIKKLDKLADASRKILLRLKAVFPFNFFRDEIIIDLSKVSINQRIFFRTGNIRSVAYEDIFEVTTNYSLIFASLSIVDRFYQQMPLEIPYLWKKDALRARRVIQGVMIAKKEKININDVPQHLLLEKVETLGRARESVPA